ncbi:MAG: A/G-specific adenine glycosylase [Ruminococcaceae bacterium]|nr:A/G-specific adenine glycosylase [Oscillospiraceae bacterium]
MVTLADTDRQSEKTERELRKIVAPLLEWFGENARSMPWRSDPTPYHVWLSEIMLQQTRVEAVRGYYDRFLTALPDIPSLAAAPEEALLKLWQGLGYYNRVRNLQKAAITVCERYGGALPADYEKLKELPGFGEYTAGAVASIAFGIPAAAVDGNVLRVIARITGCEGDITLTRTKKQIAALVSKMIPADKPGEFNQALMELGATVCLPNGAPLCDVCPVAKHCVARREEKTHIIPVKSPKKARKIEEKTILLLLCGNRVAIQKRPKTGLLAGLWEFPSAEEFLDLAASAHAKQSEDLTHIRERISDMGAGVIDLFPLARAKHIFTHIEWHMGGILVRLRMPFGNFKWASADELRHAYSIPTALSVYTRAALERLEGDPT